MKYVNIDSVETGQYLGKAIFNSNGTVLLSEGVQLTVFMINQLRRIGVSSVYIKDELFDDIEVEDVLSDETKRQVIRQMSETFQSIRSGKEFNTRHVSTTIDRLLDDVLTNKDLLIQLSDIRTEDNQHYIHAMNVCTMASVMGMNMDLNASQLKDLAIGALLHDIGKIGTGKDNELGELRKHHTWRGFEILKAKQEYSLMVAHIAFQHHEYVDGTGVPRGVEGDKIHLYAKIVAVANVFDNLINELSGKKRMLPHEACEHMMALSGKQLDHDVLIQFLRTVSVYPNGTSVKLSNRETGVVVGQHRGLPGRPIVRVVNKEEDGELEVKEVDLARHTTLFIDAVMT